MINKNTIKIKNLKTSTSVYLSLVNWRRVFPTGYPHFCVGMPSCLHLVGLVQSWFPVAPCRWVEGIKPPLCQWQGSLYNWVGVFHIKVGDDGSLKNLTWRGAYPFHTPQWSCYHDSVLWVVVAAIQSAIWWHLWVEMSIPPPNVCNPVDIHAHYTLPGIFTHLQWMLQQMSMGEVVASCWSIPGKSFWPDAGWTSDHHLLMV